MVLDAVSQGELFLNVFVGVYILTIFAYILTSWIQLPYSLRPVQRFLYDLGAHMASARFPEQDRSPVAGFPRLGGLNHRRTPRWRPSSVEAGGRS